MSPHDPMLLRRWLEAERADSAEAEAALTALLTALPPAAPAAGFAARVVARMRSEATGSLRLGVRRRALAGLASALCLATCLAVTPWLLGPAVAALAGGPSLPTWLADGVSRASQLLVSSILGLDRLFELARGVAATAARTPSMALGMLAALSFTALAFWVLQRTLARERMVPHADF